ncbi:MAG: transcription antitermination factor NusB [Clostridia bacterium]|nr:transcription antitermination factor NusB [Clostridia bacterium]
MINRRKAREYAFILLFEYKFQPEEIQDLLDNFLAEHEAGNQAAYIREVVEGTVSHIEEIDALIAAYAKGWSTDRISVVCMAAMRLAAYEMKYMESIPLNVSVNEAVTITKEYDGEESVAFVNGVLGNMKENC